MNIEENLKNRWSRFQTARWVFSVFVAIGIAMIILFETETFVDSMQNIIFFLIPISIAGGISGAYIVFWHCPRCDKSYSYKFESFVGVFWPWLKGCMHCGLPFGTVEFEEIRINEKLSPDHTTKSAKCSYSHLPEDNPLGICKGCGKEI